MNINYTCVKCGSRQYETGEMRATGGTLSKIFDVQNKKFSYISCRKCHYTELYKASTGALSNIFDFFTS